MQIYLAPMEGITTFVYRSALHRHYGGVDRYFTPFISSPKLNYKEINDVLPAHNQGITLIPQILTNQAETFLAIAGQLADYGYPEVNLNLGCPSGTVVSRKRGAGFLGVPWLLDAFLEEIFEKCPLKISIKTRVGIVSLDEWEDLLKIYAKYPLSELIIHPRLQREFYSGAPHAECFGLAQELLSVPLCYNGDITSEASLVELREKIGVPDTVMIGRGVLSNPELPTLLNRAGDPCPPRGPHAAKRQNTLRGPAHKEKSPASSETGDLKTFQAFHDEILEGYCEIMSGEQPVLFRMKELWSYMGRYIDLSDKQLKKLQKTKHLSEYRELLESFLS